MQRIVLIAGFESFNADLYRQAAQLAQARCPEPQRPGLQVSKSNLVLVCRQGEGKHRPQQAEADAQRSQDRRDQ